MTNRMTPGEDRVTVTMSMTRTMLEGLDQMAAAADVNRSALFRRIFAAAMREAGR